MVASSSPDRIVGAEGLVKWFDPKKGFGFIVGPEGQDIFTHYSKIDGEGFRVLKDGTMVIYDAVRGDKGWQATRVVRTETPDAPGGAPGGVGPVKKTYSRTPRR